MDETIKNINKNKTFSKTSSKTILKFHFQDGEELSIDKNIFLLFDPTLINNSNFQILNLNDNSYQINIPKYIKKEDLSIYLSLLDNNEKNSFKEENIFSINDSRDMKANKLMNLLKLSDFFNTEDLNVKLIKDLILPFNYDNIIIDLLDFSYKKLCVNSEQKEQNNVYFDLFYQCLENISKNEKMVLNNLEKIKYLDKKVIDEIIEKTFQNLIYGTTLLLEEKNEKYKEYDKNSNEITIDNLSPLSSNFQNTHILKEKQFKELIYFLMEIKNKTNFFDLLTSEYAFLLSKESINELKNLPHPSLQVDIHFSDYSYYSQEFPLEYILNHKKIILVVSYKKFDQSFNVCLKLSNNINEKKTCNSILEIDKISEEKFIEENSCFKIFTFLTHVIITKGPERIKIATQNNLLSLSNSKTVYSILKVSNFDNELRNFLIREPEKEYFSVIIHIKLCYIYSALASFLLNEFLEYSKEANICKISKQLLILILENKYLNLKDKDIVETILLWLQDEINIKEDISSIFNLIKWEDIDDTLIFELIIKYSHIIVGNKILEKKFIDAFEKKYKNPLIIENILKSLFIAGQKIEYSRIFSQMKKTQKFNKAYQYFNSETKLKGIFYGLENSSSKDSCSFKDGIKQFLMNNNVNNNAKNNEKKEKEKEKEIQNIHIFNNNKEKEKEKEKDINNQNKISNKNNNNDDKQYEIQNINNIYKNNNKNNNRNYINKNNINNNKNNNNKKYNEQIIFYKNNANFLKKNLSFLNIKHNKINTTSKINLNKKNIKNTNIKKISFSYIKNGSSVNNINNIRDKNNINNVNININNISNINISNNNYSNYKTHNNNYFSKNYPNKNNDNAISLTFYSGKSQEKCGGLKQFIKKNNKNIKNSPFKLFSTENNDNNYHKSNIKKLDTNAIKGKGKNNSNKKNQKKINSLLSTILNYDKITNKSKYPNKNNGPIKK